jgi:hypothetical protein
LKVTRVDQPDPVIEIVDDDHQDILRVLCDGFKDVSDANNTPECHAAERCRCHKKLSLIDHVTRLLTAAPEPEKLTSGDISPDVVSAH